MQAQAPIQVKAITRKSTTIASDCPAQPQPAPVPPATIQLSSIIAGNKVSKVTTQDARLTDQGIAQCICNASIGELSTRQLLAHFSLLRPDQPHNSFRDWACDKGLWKTWTTKGGKVKPLNVGERRHELQQIHGKDASKQAEWRVLAQYDALRVMLARDKDLADKAEKDRQSKLTPEERAALLPPEPPKPPQQAQAPQVHNLPSVTDRYQTIADQARHKAARLLAMVGIDSELSWIATELQGIVDTLTIKEELTIN